MNGIERVYALMGLQFELLGFLTSEIREVCLNEEVNLDTLKVLVKNAAISADTLENLSRGILNHMEEGGKK